MQSGQTGAMVFIGMNKGDTVNLSVNANYEVAPTGNGLLGAGFAALFTSFDNIYGSGVEGGISSQQSNFEDALTGTNMAGKGDPGTAPRAFLNYIVFDKNMEYVSAGFVQITTAAQGIGVHENIFINNIIADEESYVLAYLSNENQEAVNVHFDDFEVYHGKTNVVQSDDYYPFGLTFNGYQRTASTPNAYQYNGKETIKEWGVIDYGWRMYMPDIGRWNGIDLLAEKYAVLSPYNYTANNPIKFNDPDGREIWIYYKEAKTDKDGNVKTNKKGETKYKTRRVKYEKGMDFGGDNDFVKNAIAGLDHLQDSGADKEGIVSKVAESKKNVKLKEGSEGQAEYDGGNNTIEWDPFGGLKVQNGKQSPTLGLLHEIGHAFGDLFEKKEYKRRSKTYLREDWFNEEEKHVIETYENPAAVQLNEAKRVSHKDGSYYKTVHPNSTKEDKSKKTKN